MQLIEILLKYSFLSFPYSIGNVLPCAGEPPLAGLPRCPARTAGRLRPCPSASPRAVVCTGRLLLLQLFASSRSAPVNKIGLMCSGRCKVCYQEACYSIARFGFLIRCVVGPLVWRPPGGRAGSDSTTRPIFPATHISREWWGILDSNQRPQSYQDCALTS